MIKEKHKILLAFYEPVTTSKRQLGGGYEFKASCTLKLYV
jgi:hypothetical protein